MREGMNSNTDIWKKRLVVRAAFGEGDAADFAVGNIFALQRKRVAVDFTICSACEW